MTTNKLYFYPNRTSSNVREFEIGHYLIGVSPNPNNVGICVIDTESGNIIKCLTLKYPEMQTSADRRLYRSSRRHLIHTKARLAETRDILTPIASQYDIDIDKSFKNSSDDENELLKRVNKNTPTMAHLLNRIVYGTEVVSIEEYLAAIVFMMKHRGHTYIKNINVDDLGKSDILVRTIDFLHAKYPKENMHIKDVDKLTAILLSDAKNNDKKAALVSITDGTKTMAYKVFCAIIAGSISKTFYAQLFEFSDPYIKAGENEGSALPLTAVYEEAYEQLQNKLNDDFDVIAEITKIYNWIIVTKIMRDRKLYSEILVDKYELYKRDLQDLEKSLTIAHSRAFARNFMHDSSEKYGLVRMLKGKATYAKFSSQVKELLDGCNNEFVKDFKTNFETDKDKKSDNQRELFKKPMNSDNSIFPRSIIRYEFIKVLDRFIADYNVDENVKNDLLTVFDFDLPYWVGPLSKDSENYWLVRNSGYEDVSITPFNFNDVVNEEKTQENFIERLIGYCSICGNLKVMAKNSPYYIEFAVLNMLNSIKVDGKEITVAEKNAIFHDLIKSTTKKITKSDITTFLHKKFGYPKNAVVTGIVDQIPQTGYLDKKMDSIIGAKKDDYELVDKIVYILTFAQTKSVKNTKLEQSLGNVLTAEEIEKLSDVSFSGWGNLSKYALTELKGKNGKSILEMMRDTNLNLEQLKHDDNFTDAINNYYINCVRITSPYISVDVLKQFYPFENFHGLGAIMRILTQIHRVVCEMNAKPEKIVVISTRRDDEKVPSKTRRQKLVAVYKKAKYDKSNSPEEKAMYDFLNDSKNTSLLAIDAVYQYFCQFGHNGYGKCESIPFKEFIRHYQVNKTGDSDDSKYNMDHIYPESLGGEDSVQSNMMLTTTALNQSKNDVFPLPSNIKTPEAIALWKLMLKNGTMTETKYNRLMKNEPYDSKEAEYFLEKQLVAKGKLAKNLRDILTYFNIADKVLFVNPDLIYRFRNKYNILKMRNNDYYYGVDAYIAGIVGPLFDAWRRCKKKKSGVTKFFEFPIVIGDEEIWGGSDDARYDRIIKTAQTLHPDVIFIKSKKKIGKLFDETIYSPKKVPGDMKRVIPVKRNADPMQRGYKTSLDTHYFFVKMLKNGKMSFEAIPRLFADNPEALKEYLDKCKAEEILTKNRIYPGHVVYFNNNPELPIIIRGVTNNNITFAPAKQLDLNNKYCQLLACIELTKKNSYVYDTNVITDDACIELYDEILRVLDNDYYYRTLFGKGILFLKEKREKFESFETYKKAIQLQRIIEWTRCTSTVLEAKLFFDSSTTKPKGVFVFSSYYVDCNDKNAAEILQLTSIEEDGNNDQDEAA